MIEVWEDDKGAMYHVRGKAEMPLATTCGGEQVINLTLYSPLALDDSPRLLATETTYFCEHFRRVPHEEFARRAQAAMDEQERLNEPYIHEPPKDGEIAGLPKQR